MRRCRVGTRCQTVCRVWASAQAASTASICMRTRRARRVSCVAVSSPWRWVTSCRMRRSSCLSASPSRMTCCTRLGVCEIATMTVRWPRSIRFASATSSSRVKSGTRLISAKYTRTRSLDESGRLGVRSVSAPSSRPRRVSARSSDSESTSMPASRHWLSRSSRTDAVPSGGRTVSISSRRRYPFSCPSAMSWRMVSSGSPLDTKARSARATIVSAYASTVAAAAEMSDAPERGPPGCGLSNRRAARAERHRGSGRLTTEVGTAGVIDGTSGDGARPSHRGGTSGGSVTMKATGGDALNLIRHWKDEQAPLRCTYTSEGLGFSVTGRVRELSDSVMSINGTACGAVIPLDGVSYRYHGAEDIPKAIQRVTRCSSASTPVRRSHWMARSTSSCARMRFSESLRPAKRSSHGPPRSPSGRPNRHSTTLNE